MRWIVVALFMFMACASQAFALGEGQAAMKAGDAHRAKFENARALAEYKKASERLPESFMAALNLTQAYIDVGEDLDSGKSKAYYEQAIEHAKGLVARYPERAEAHHLLALANGKLAQFKGGKEKVKMSRMIENRAKKAVELDPDYYRPYILLGVYYREVANLNWFLKMFAKTFFGGLPEGTNEMAVENLKKSIELNGAFPRTWYELGETYEVMNEKEKAAESYRKFLALPVVDHLDKRYKAKAKERLAKLEK